MAHVFQPSMVWTAENSRLSKSKSNTPVTFPVFSMRRCIRYRYSSGVIGWACEYREMNLPVLRSVSFRYLRSILAAPNSSSPGVVL